METKWEKKNAKIQKVVAKVRSSSSLLDFLASSILVYVFFFFVFILLIKTQGSVYDNQQADQQALCDAIDVSPDVTCVNQC